ncbi:TetR/AcrR family transcriptional regulator [Rhodococcus rhodnii]|uniref:TetR family transcriptional regulator n=2 Tax=Rhodococcus rhodnii TaxID=38312 RepID=R7WTA6_9NOCA|nr:TetR family transcriptional regulator [Rhodococcus rhodnii]EOM78483.1 TetR family transcriptional regulator [Rhodococcus rhodnii LMG 5362]TXG91282.1 TetR/AcrR family transcriptional regulator [Rhodococcus rhodnii]
MTRGRPRGGSDSRERILTHARQLFAANGFRGTTVRAVADAAGVDPALVHHFHGTKRDLFLAAIALPVDPGVIVTAALDVPRERLGEAFATVVLGAWEAEHRPALEAAVRSVLVDGDGELVSSFLGQVLIARIAPLVDDPPGSGERRAAWAVTQMAGVLLLRYLRPVRPVCDEPVENVIRAIAPTLQHHLAGPPPPE